MNTIDNFFSHPLFKDADPLVLSEALDSAGCERIKYKSGEWIFSSKKNENKIGFIEKGKAVVFSEDAERSVILRNLYPGDVFGVSTVFSSSDGFVSNIIAKSPCTIQFIDANLLKKLLEEDKNIMFNYIQFLSQKIRMLNKKIACFTAGSSEKRLYFYLEGLASKDGILELDVSMITLSEMLDIGRASLYRAFDKLEKDGFIIKEGKKIKIVNKIN